MSNPLAERILNGVIQREQNKLKIQELHVENREIEHATIRDIVDAGAYNLLKLDVVKVRRFVQNETDYII